MRGAPNGGAPSVPPASGRTSLTLIGIVLPRDVAAGEEFHATVVMDLKSYGSVPGLRVLELVAPLSDGPSGRPSLDGLLIRCGSGRVQPAAEILSCTSAVGDPQLTFALSRVPEGAAAVLASAPAQPSRKDVPAGFATPPICVAGAVQVIEGPFGGAADAARVQVGDRPASVIAQSARALYWSLPAGTPEGENRLRLQTSFRSVSLPIWVARLGMTADRLSLASGESTPFHAVLSGLRSLPDFAWQAGLPAGLVDSDRLAELVPGFPLPGPGDAGVIVLSIVNASRDAITLENSSDQRIVIPVSRRDLRDGVFRYDGVIRSRRAGPFSISASVLPLLSPIAAQELAAAGVLPGGAGSAR